MVRTGPWSIFGPPSPPPSAPLSSNQADSSIPLQFPPLNLLPSLVDSAADTVRLYWYRIPTYLEDALDLNLRQVSNKTSRMVRGKHPWINLEDSIWRLLPSSIWTEDPENATFYVVPHAYLGHKCVNPSKASEAQHVKRGIARFFEHIYYAEPYYNRSRGRNHITTWVLENGIYCDCRWREEMVNETLAFDILKSMIKVGYWGHDDVSMFGWQRGFDIAMPQFGAVSPSLGPPPSWQEVVSSQKYSFGFSGSYWGGRVSCPAIDRGSPPGSLGAAHYCECSPGSRIWLQGYLTKHCNTSISPTTRCSGLSAKMGTFWYALCPAAWACWSSRLYHAIDRLTVPAIMADGAIQPFESLLDWQSFAVKLDTKRLMSYNASQLDHLHHDGLAVAHHCTSCQDCHQCTRLPLVKRVRQLERVRTWFLYNSSTLYSAFGLFILELHCRHWYLTKSSYRDGVCREYPELMQHMKTHRRKVLR